MSRGKMSRYRVALYCDECGVLVGFGTPLEKESLVWCPECVKVKGFDVVGAERNLLPHTVTADLVEIRSLAEAG